MKILVVDDEELLVKGIRFNLQNEGYDVLVGYNGLEAVEKAKTEHPDIIILDIMMPHMDGLTACAKIREFSDVPIILLTAKVEDMDKLMGFEQGADDYLTKPFNILELKARIRALLRRSVQAGTGSSAELQIGSIRLDMNSRNAYRSGVLVELTAKEFWERSLSETDAALLDGVTLTQYQVLEIDDGLQPAYFYKTGHGYAYEPFFNAKAALPLTTRKNEL